MRVNETKVADAVLQILNGNGPDEASIASLVRDLPNYLDLSEEDRTRSKTRPNEEIWEQQVRNITSHQKSPGNFVYEGYLEVIPGGLRITEAGRKRASRLGG